MKKALLLLLMALVLATGCSSKTPESPSGETGGELPGPAENPDLGTAYVVGMNISVRKAAGTGSEKIGALHFPAEVVLLEKSDSPEAIGGQDAFWFKVRTEDLEGWCFGAYLSSEEELPEMLEERLDELLPIDKSTTVSKSVSTLKSVISMTEAVDLIDAGVMRIHKLQENLLPALEAEMLPLTETLYGYEIKALRNPENLPDGVVRSLMERYVDMGYSVYMSEGMYFLDPSPKFLLGNFKTAISDELYDYLSYRSEEVERHTYSDAAIVITWDELADRMVSWEKFMDKYPNSIRLDEVKSMYEMYRFSFFIGASNTPAYDYPNEILDPKLLDAYENYVTRFPDSSLTPALENLLVLLEEESYQKTERIQEFIDPYNPYHYTD